VIPSNGATKIVKLYRTIAVHEETVQIRVPIKVWEDGDGVDGFPITHDDNKGKIPADVGQISLNLD